MRDVIGTETPLGPPAASSHPSRRAAEVFVAFLRLGLSSFGGPVAHLGYFRAEFVGRRRWLDETSYADLVALCQYLPGPSSSQVGVALGMGRAGLVGGLAAWGGFTLPSAGALVLFAYGVGLLGDVAHASWLHGLKIVAVAVVAQAVWGMATTLCTDRQRISLALYTPVWTSAIYAPVDAAIGLVAFALLAIPKWPPWLVVILGASITAAFGA